MFEFIRFTLYTDFHLSRNRHFVGAREVGSKQGICRNEKKGAIGLVFHVEISETLNVRKCTKSLFNVVVRHTVIDMRKEP